MEGRWAKLMEQKVTRREALRAAGAAGGVLIGDGPTRPTETIYARARNYNQQTLMADRESQGPETVHILIASAVSAAVSLLLRRR